MPCHNQKRRATYLHCTLDERIVSNDFGMRGLRVIAGLLRTLDVVACRSFRTVGNGFRPSRTQDDPKNLVEFTGVTSCCL